MNNKLINRTLASSLSEVFRILPVITLTGPRQSGKTTLCRELFSGLPYVSLENVTTLSELQSDPTAFFSRYENGVIIDEAQHFPDVFSYIQVIIDEDRFKGTNQHHYVVTGSSNFALMERISQSMAGRTAVFSLLPLSTAEILAYNPNATTSQMILNGGYPAIWMIPGDVERETLMSNYYTTYIERDVRSLINIKDMQAFQLFIRLCASRVGQEFNASAISNEIGVSVNTIKSWLSILSASYITFLLHPYHTNIGKRLTKTPKLYFYDTGLAAFLLGINTEQQMDFHPLRGSLFENMIIADMMKHGFNHGKTDQLFFYRDKSQHEVDLLRLLPPNLIEAYEIKSSKTWNADFFSNLNYLRKLLQERMVKSNVIYDGDLENPQNENGYVNFRHAHVI
ncbi:MAG: ATP-binding protein [Bacteroidaceae bacterium]|nr:ATP-binding protein [Bacteroidaceae bacterium]